MENLRAANPNFDTTTERLYRSLAALKESGETTTEGVPVADTLEPLLIPWGVFRAALEQDRDRPFDNIVGFVNIIRSDREGDGNTSPIQYDGLSTEYGELFPLAYSGQQGSDQLLTLSDYLDSKIAQDGPWGIMLTQVGKEADVASLVANQEHLTGQSELPTVAGVHVDKLGVFEWLTMVAQFPTARLRGEDQIDTDETSRRNGEHQDQLEWLASQPPARPGAIYIPVSSDVASPPAYTHTADTSLLLANQLAAPGEHNMSLKGNLSNEPSWTRLGTVRDTATLHWADRRADHDHIRATIA